MESCRDRAYFRPGLFSGLSDAVGKRYISGMSKTDVRKLMGLDLTRSSLSEAKEKSEEETHSDGLEAIFAGARAGERAWALRELKLGIAGGRVDGDPESTRQLSQWLDAPSPVDPNATPKKPSVKKKVRKIEAAEQVLKPVEEDSADTDPDMAEYYTALGKAHHYGALAHRVSKAAAKDASNHAYAAHAHKEASIHWGNVIGHAKKVGDTDGTKEAGKHFYDHGLAMFRHGKKKSGSK